MLYARYWIQQPANLIQLSRIQNRVSAMTEWDTDKLVDWDKRFVWHPFTDMCEWCAPEHEPLVLVEGRGALLRDSKGREYMRRWSAGTLRAVREWCSRADTLLIVDEVMTGFGRNGRMFASEHEGVVPDMMVLGKGLTGGYLPLAVTLISEKLFSTFNGSVAEGK